MQDTPPMDMPQDMGNGDMGGDFMPQGDMQPMADPQSQFDTNFDAGVDADEEQDPKKYIQQLTGKLSQSLRKYNEDNGQPDVDLNKYVAGMIVKQSMEGLSQEDADEIIDKVKADEDFTMDDGNGQNDGMGQMPQDGQQMMSDPNQQQMPMDNGMGGQMNESNQRKFKKHLEEIINGVLNQNGDEKPQYHKSTSKGGFRTKPFKSPF